MDVVERVISDMRTRGRMQQIAAATGIPVKTLRNLRYGVTSNPRYDLVKRLQEFYAQEEATA